MYTPLYVKTDYSLLSSLIKIDELVENLKKKNISSCAIVDDNLYGTMEVIHKFNKAGIKPIIGLDLKEILLYAKTSEGYYNLVKIETLKNEELKFEYRNSIISQKNIIVLETRLKLKKGESQEIKSKMDEYAKSRKEKQPIEYPSAGSTFKRGKDFITAKLIDEAGLKGYQIGGAQISEKHAGFIINKGDATATDILNLIEYVKKEIHKKFDKNIELEVQVIGEK